MKTIVLLTIVLATLAACTGSAGQTARYTTPDDLVASVQAAGLQTVDPQPMTKDDYGAAPLVATGVRFLIPTLCADCGGRAFVGNPNDIEALRNYYTALSESSALLFSWVFVSPDGRALLQINGDLPEDQAKQYKTVIEQP